MNTTEQEEKVLQAQREYAREWRNRPGNKERTKEYKRRYWLKKAAELEQKKVD